jgi:hypothetical protein
MSTAEKIAILLSWLAAACVVGPIVGRAFARARLAEEADEQIRRMWRK